MSRKNIVSGHNVSVVIEIDLAGEHLGVGHVTDAEKHAFNFQFALGPVAYVAQPQSLYGQIVDAEHFVDYGVGAQLDIRMRDGTFEHDLRCTESLASVQQRDPGREASEEQRFLHGRIAAADDSDRLAAKKKPSHVAQLETP